MDVKVLGFYAVGNFMKSIQNLKLSTSATIKQALQVIADAGMQIALIVDKKIISLAL